MYYNKCPIKKHKDSFQYTVSNNLSTEKKEVDLGQNISFKANTSEVSTHVYTDYSVYVHSR